MPVLSINHIRYNCFLLLLPPLLWNVFLIDYLPRNYSDGSVWTQVPWGLTIAEDIFRISAFTLLLAMYCPLKTTKQQYGLVIYIVGLFLYFASWLIQIAYPDSTWSTSFIGYAAPAYTPWVWLIGIGLTGESFVTKTIPLTNLYFVISIIFLLIHFTHVSLSFSLL